MLVTGGGGFLGRRICQALAARGDTVTAFDIDAPREGLAAGVRFAAGDLLEWSQIVEALRQPTDAVIHCAAIVGIVAGAQAPQKTMRVNVEGSIHLFEAMRLWGVKRVIHISSEETYGPFAQDRITEEHAQHPVTIYGISKLAVEGLGRAYREAHGLECINVRTGWVYGPDLPRARIPKNLVDAALAGRPLHLPAGAGMRVDHVHVADLVAGVLAALDKPAHRFDAYHIASGTAPSVREIIELIREVVPAARLSAGDGPYLYGDRIPVVRKGVMDIQRARDELGYAPRFDMRRGLHEWLAGAS